MSERSGSPCSDRNIPNKKKKIHKSRHDDSERISETGQNKITHYFRNIEKKQKPDPKLRQKMHTNLEAELVSLRQQQRKLGQQKESIQQQQIQMRHNKENWIKKSKCLIQDCMNQIYRNVRIRKAQVDPEKGFYDQNCRIFTQGPFGQAYELKKNHLENLLANKEYKDDKEKIILQQFLQKEKEALHVLKKQLNSYKQRLRNAYEQKVCKFVNSWPLLKNRYQVLQLIGRGGFSEVYKAYDLEDNKYIAIKRSSTAELKNDLQHYIVREYQNHLKLDHPNIAKFYEVVEVVAHQSVCIALEYCEGPELSTYMKEYQRLPQSKAKQIILQILEALNYLSSLQPKIIHYDLKPQNIMFSNGKIKILDFGLSKQIDNQHSKIALSNQGVGTYWYLPPEAFNEKNPQISEKVDIWSAGVILYEMIIGKKPFGHNKSQNSIIHEGIILQAMQVEFPDDIDISQEAKSLIRHCLSYDPHGRYSPSQALSHPFFKK